jgi:hypothetical protein
MMMISRDQLMEDMSVRREELMQRAEIGREELARRAEEIRAQFAEHVNQDAVTTFAGWTLVSTGIAWGVTDWLRGRRTLRSLLLPIGLIVLGTAVLGGSNVLQRREEHIGEAEMRVREELSALDPFARFRILKDMTEETVPFVRRISGQN